MAYSPAMQTFQDLIAQWDTVAAFAVDVGVPYQRARKWRDRNNIPPEYWPRLVAVCRSHGLSGVNPVKLMTFAGNARRERA
jgi:hypothetical protein